VIELHAPRASAFAANALVAPGLPPRMGSFVLGGLRGSTASPMVPDAIRSGRGCPSNVRAEAVITAQVGLGCRGPSGRVVVVREVDHASVPAARPRGRPGRLCRGPRLAPSAVAAAASRIGSGEGDDAMAGAEELGTTALTDQPVAPLRVSA